MIEKKWSIQVLVPGQKRRLFKAVNFIPERSEQPKGDSTYYAIPDKRNTYLWVDRTPEDFNFHIKVYGALTGHGIDPKTLPKDIMSLLPAKDKEIKTVYVKEHSLLKVIAERFREAITPLIEAHKLGVLVYQFPPWFQYKTANLDYLLTCKELMQELPVAVEFRHGSWLAADRRDSVLHFLQKNRLTYITADEPQYGNLATIPFFPD